jgi:hypothetical protein
MASDTREEERGDAGRQPEQSVIIGRSGQRPRDQPGHPCEQDGGCGETRHSELGCQLKKVIVRVFCAVRRCQRRREEQRRTWIVLADADTEPRACADHPEACLGELDSQDGSAIRRIHLPLPFQSEAHDGDDDDHQGQ